MPTLLCPPREKLIGFSVGDLAEEEIESVTDHLESCAECDSTVALLEERSDTFIGRLRRPDIHAHFADEPEFAEAVAGANAIVPEFGKQTAIEAPVHRLGDYRPLRQLGRGGMGVVYKALHTRLQRVVALKVLSAERRRHAGAANRFKREIEAVGKLDHPHIVRAYDAGEVDGTQFLVMEMVEGTDLRGVVRQLGPLRIADACELVRQAATGLQHAHEHGLVHRDVKPSNLLLSREGRLKVLDLGLALLHEDIHQQDELTNTGQIMGTLDYMAPEQADDSHAVDARADIYSLGCTLYKLLSGRAPFSGGKFDTAARKIVGHASQTPRPIQELRSEIPHGLAHLITRMLAKDPADRPCTAAEVATALEPWSGDSDLGSLAERVRPVMEDAGDMPASPSEIESMLHAPSSVVKRLDPKRAWWRTKLLFTASVSLFVCLLLGVIIIISRNKNHNPTKLDVPDGSHVKIDDKGRVAVTLPDKTPPRSGQSGADTQGDSRTPPAVKRAEPDRRPRGVAFANGTFRVRHPSTRVGTYAAFSPDGKLLASATSDGVIRVWDTSTGQLLREMRSVVRHVDDFLHPIAFSPDGKMLVSAAKNLTFWEVANGRKIREIKLKQPLYSLAVSPDGKTLAGCFQNKVYRWDLHSGLALATFALPPWNELPAWCRSVFYADDGRLMAELHYPADQDPLLKVQLWDVVGKRAAATTWSGGVPREFGAVLAAGRIVVSAHYSPKLSRLISVGLRNIDEKEDFIRIAVDDPKVKVQGTVAISPDRRMIAVCWSDGSVGLYVRGEDAESHRERKPPFPWSWPQIISASTLQAEIVAIHAALAKDLTTMERFRNSDHRKARRNFSKLAVLFAIISEYDGRVRYRNSAAVAWKRFAKAGFDCKAGSAAVYRIANQRKADLASMLAGVQLEGEPAKLDWAIVSDLSSLMQWMSEIEREELSKHLADQKAINPNRDKIRHNAELIWAISTVLRQLGMEHVEESDYANMLEQFSRQARDLTIHAHEQNYGSAVKTLGAMKQQCATCHSEFRDVAAATGAELRSGLEVGTRISVFSVVKCSGATEDGVKVGARLCYRSKYGNRPMVMVFARTPDKSLVSLIKQLDNAVAAAKEKQLRALVNLLGDNREKLEKAATELGDTNKIAKVAIVVPVEFENGPKRYGLNPKADVTVLLVKRSTVVGNFAFAEGELNDANIKAIVTACRWGLAEAHAP